MFTLNSWISASLDIFKPQYKKTTVNNWVIL